MINNGTELALLIATVHCMSLQDFKDCFDMPQTLWLRFVEYDHDAGRFLAYLDTHNLNQLWQWLGRNRERWSTDRPRYSGSVKTEIV